MDLLPSAARQGGASSGPQANQLWGSFEDSTARRAGASREARFDYRQALMDALEANARTPEPAERRLVLA